MSKHRAVSERTVRNRTVLAGAMTSGALLAGGLGAAGPAGADCISISGLTLGKGCKSAPLSVAVGLGNGAGAQAKKPLTFNVNNVIPEEVPPHDLTYEQFVLTVTGLAVRVNAISAAAYEAERKSRAASGYGSDGKPPSVGDDAARTAAEAAWRKAYDEFAQARNAVVVEKDILIRKYPDYAARYAKLKDAPTPKETPEDARAAYEKSVKALYEAEKNNAVTAATALWKAYADLQKAKEVAATADAASKKKAADDAAAKQLAYEKSLADTDEAAHALADALNKHDEAQEKAIRAELAALIKKTSHPRPLDPIRDFIAALTPPDSSDRGTPDAIKTIVDKLNPSTGGGHRLLDPVGKALRGFAPITETKKTTDTKKTPEEKNPEEKPEKNTEEKPNSSSTKTTSPDTDADDSSDPNHESDSSSSQSESDNA